MAVKRKALTKTSDWPDISANELSEFLKVTLDRLSAASRLKAADQKLVFFPEGIQLITFKLTIGANTVELTVRGDRAKSGGVIQMEGQL